MNCNFSFETWTITQTMQNTNSLPFFCVLHFLVLRRAKTAEVLRVPTADNSELADTREAKVKRNGVNFCCNCCFSVYLFKELC